VKVLILWSGAVVPAYRQFFHELAKYMQVRALAPKRWTHGSISFQNASVDQLDDNPQKRSAESMHSCEIIPVLYIPEASSRYFVPSLIFHLWGFRPRYLYIMDEMDRISLTWHALIAKLVWPTVKIICYSLQNLTDPSYYRWHHRLALRLNQKLIYRGIAASQEAEHVLRGHGYRGATCVIPLWGAENFFYPGAPAAIQNFRKSLGVPPSAITLLYCGGLVEAKGLRLLIDVLPRYPRIKLITAGLGPLQDSLRNGLGDQWIHLGALEGDSLRQFYQAGDYIILPSLTLPHWKEQVGRSLIEGILSGCVALGSDSGHIPELTLFPETAFRQGDSQALGKMLESLPLPRSESIRLAQRQNIFERFTASVVALRTFQFLETGL
jgi:glycosyltransferase involved in cell wall biosynthesis